MSEEIVFQMRLNKLKTTLKLKGIYFEWNIIGYHQNSYAVW